MSAGVVASLCVADTFQLLPVMTAMVDAGK